MIAPKDGIVLNVIDKSQFLTYSYNDLFMIFSCVKFTNLEKLIILLFDLLGNEANIGATLDAIQF